MYIPFLIIGEIIGHRNSLNDQAVSELISGIEIDKTRASFMEHPILSGCIEIYNYEKESVTPIYKRLMNLAIGAMLQDNIKYTHE